MILPDEMIDIGIRLMVSGMTGVFIVLSLLAFVMWAMGKIFGRSEAGTANNINSKNSDSILSERELLAIAAAIFHHEGIHVPEIRGPENWKKLARAGWCE